MSNAKYYLGVLYEEGDTSTYQGVFIDKDENNKSERIIFSNKYNDVEKDIEDAMDCLDEFIDEDISVTFLSSYDNYYMDLEYENDPEVRAEIDAIGKEFEEALEKHMIENNLKEIVPKDYSNIFNNLLKKMEDK